MMKGIYVASKIRHAPIWRQFRSEGFLIISSWLDAPWIDAGVVPTSEQLTSIWKDVIDEVKACSAVIVYAEPGDVLRGAYVEAGAALACGKPVYVIGSVEGDWLHHPLVKRFERVLDAIVDVYVSQASKEGT